MIFQQILNKDSGLSTRAKLNSMLSALIQSDEGVNAVWVFLKSLEQAMQTLSSKEDNDVADLRDSLSGANDYTDKAVNKLYTYVDAMNGGVGGLIDSTSYDPSGLPTDKPCTLIALGSGTFTNLKDSNNTAITVSQSNSITVFFRAAHITYWNYKTEVLTAPPMDATPTDGNTTHVVSSDGVYDFVMAHGIDDVDVADTTGSDYFKDRIVFTMRKNMGTVSEPEYETIAAFTIPVATATKAGLMPAYVDGVFDVNRYVGSNTPYDSLSQVLNNAATLIPTAVRRGGMSIKFIQSSDNKYVQARCMAQNFTTDVTQWQGVDDEPTAGSNNLVKSDGTSKVIFNGFFVGNNNTLAFHYTEGMIPNHTYRIALVTNNWDRTGVVDPSWGHLVFGIGTETSGTTTGIVAVNSSSSVPKSPELFYDVKLPASFDKVYVAGRASFGVKVWFTITDITSSLPYINRIYPDLNGFVIPSDTKRLWLDINIKSNITGVLIDITKNNSFKYGFVVFHDTTTLFDTGWLSDNYQNNELDYPTSNKIRISVAKTDDTVFTTEELAWVKAGNYIKFYEVVLSVYKDDIELASFDELKGLQEKVDILEEKALPISTRNYISDFSGFFIKSNNRLWFQINYDSPTSVEIKIKPNVLYKYAFSINNGNTEIMYTPWLTEDYVNNELQNYPTANNVRISIARVDGNNFTTEELTFVQNGGYIEQMILGYAQPKKMNEAVASYKDLNNLSEEVEEIQDIIAPSGSLYQGERIILDSIYRYKESEFLSIDANDYPSYELLAMQSGAIYGGYIFLALEKSKTEYPTANADIVVLDYTTKEPIAKFNYGNTESHNNNIIFTDIFYDENDEFPLALLSACNSTGEFYVVRITRSGTTFSGTIINTFAFEKAPSTTACYDNDTKTLWIYCYTNNSYTYTDTNTVLVCGYRNFDLLNSIGTLTIENADVFFNTNYWCVGQGIVAKNGKLYFYNTSESRKPTNINVGVWVINPANACIESLISIPRSYEAEGISIYNGELYLMDRNEASDVHKIRIKKLTF